MIKNVTSQNIFTPPLAQTVIFLDPSLPFMDSPCGLAYLDSMIRLNTNIKQYTQILFLLHAKKTE